MCYLNTVQSSMSSVSPIGTNISFTRESLRDTTYVNILSNGNLAFAIDLRTKEESLGDFEKLGVCV